MYPKLIQCDKLDAAVTEFTLELSEELKYSVTYNWEFLADLAGGLGALLLDAFKWAIKDAKPELVQLIEEFFKKIINSEEHQQWVAGSSVTEVAMLSTWAGDYEQPQIKELPGINEIVRHPVRKEEQGRIKDIIIALNDSYGWSRDKIADWLETLDVDIKFKSMGENYDR